MSNQYFTKEELGQIVSDVMNLGMSHRQDQLSRHSDLSGREVLDSFMEGIYKAKMDKERLTK